MDNITDPIELRVPRLLLTPRQAAQALGISRSTIYELLASGELESVRIGTSRRIPVDALDRYVGGLRGIRLLDADHTHLRPDGPDTRTAPRALRPGAQATGWSGR